MCEHIPSSRQNITGEEIVEARVHPALVSPAKRSAADWLMGRCCRWGRDFRLNDDPYPLDGRRVRLTRSDADAANVPQPVQVLPTLAVAEHETPRHQDGPMTPDLRIEQHGTIALVRPSTRAGHEWLDKSARGSARQFGSGTLLCDPQELGSIVEAARRAGLGIVS